MAPKGLAWLPPNALAAAVERLPIRDTIAAWSAHWFAGPAAELIGVERMGIDARLDGDAFTHDEGMTVIAAEAAGVAVGNAMFGPPDEAATDADRIAIAHAVNAALADLRARFAQLVGMDDKAPWRQALISTSAGTCFRVRIGKLAPALTIVIGNALLAAAVRNRLPRTAHGPKVRPLAEGLALHPVAVSARLGACMLMTRDLAGLAAGDVIVLDTSLDDPVEIAIDGRPQVARCRVDARDTHLDLTMA